MNDGVVNGRSIRYSKKKDTPHFNRISDEEKDCCAVGTAHAVSCTKTTTYELLQFYRNMVGKCHADSREGQVTLSGNTAGLSNSRPIIVLICSTV